MYKYFGVGLQVLEDADGMYARFLCWLPKYFLSMPSKHSLEVWPLEVLISSTRAPSRDNFGSSLSLHLVG